MWRDVILLASIVAVCLVFGYSFWNTSIAVSGLGRVFGSVGFAASAEERVPSNADASFAASVPLIQNTSSLDDASRGYLPPLIVDVGAGSTGTRTLYKILCKLGFVGVHHRCYCNAVLEPVLQDMLYPISGTHAFNGDGSRAEESGAVYGPSQHLVLAWSRFKADSGCRMSHKNRWTAMR